LLRLFLGVLLVCGSTDLLATTFSIGVLAKGDKQITLKQWSATADYLSSRIPDHQFAIVPLENDQVEAAVRERRIDLLIADPTMFVQLESSHGLNAILTLRRRLSNGEDSDVFASAILVKVGRDDIQRIVDLKGKRFIAADKELLCWAIAWRQMHVNGIDPFKDLASLEFAGSPKAVVQAVLEGRADAGSIRSDVLERMAQKGEIDLDALRVLPEEGNVAHQLLELSVLHSTAYYPEWPLAAMPLLDHDLVRHVATALLEQKATDAAAVNAGIAGWSVPATYTSVQDLMKDLHLAQYKHYGRVGLAEAARQHWRWVLVLLSVMICLAVLTMFLFRFSARNKRINHLLQEEISEKEQVHRQLLVQNEKVQTILENIVEAYFSINNHWQIIEMNSQAQELLRIGTAEHETDDLWTRVPELASFAYKKFNASFREGKPQEFTAFYPPERMWLEFHIFPSGSEMSIYFRDVSSRVNDALQLEENERRLKAILENMLEGVVTIDIDGVVQTFNHAASMIFGYDNDEVIGKNVAMLMPESDARVHDRFVREYISTGQTKIIGIGREVFGKRRNGELFPLEIAVSEVVVQGQRMFIAIMRDLSERKQSEQRIMRLVTAIRYAAEGIFITDINGAIEYANPAYEEMTGFTQEELKGGQPWIFEQANEDKQRHDDFFDALHKGESWHGEYTASRQDGSTYEEEVTIAPVLDTNGTVICYIGISHDVTERLLNERRMRHVGKLEAVAKMAGSFGHEFNNLLSSIVGFTEMAIYEAERDSESAADLANVLEAANRANVLVKQLLDFSKQDYEEALAFLPRQTVAEAVHLLQNMLPSGAVLDADLTDVCEIHISPGEFQQIVVNLGIRSIEAIEPQEGRIAIALKGAEIDQQQAASVQGLSEGKYAVLTLSDNGAAVDPELVQTIFEPAALPTHKVNNNWMGLITAYSSVTRNNGLMTIESEEGSGTTITVYFPCLRNSLHDEVFPESLEG
jgi:PAS domain S-box-containing protein